MSFGDPFFASKRLLLQKKVMPVPEIPIPFTYPFTTASGRSRATFFAIPA